MLADLVTLRYKLSVHIMSVDNWGHAFIRHYLTTGRKLRLLNNKHVQLLTRLYGSHLLDLCTLRRATSVLGKMAHYITLANNIRLGILWPL